MAPFFGFVTLTLALLVLVRAEGEIRVWPLPRSLMLMDKVQVELPQGWYSASSASINLLDSNIEPSVLTAALARFEGRVRALLPDAPAVEEASGTSFLSSRLRQGESAR